MARPATFAPLYRRSHVAGHHCPKMGHKFILETLSPRMAHSSASILISPRMMAMRGGGIRTANACDPWALCTNSQRSCSVTRQGQARPFGEAIRYALAIAACPIGTGRPDPFGVVLATGREPVRRSLPCNFNPVSIEPAEARGTGTELSRPPGPGFRPTYRHGSPDAWGWGDLASPGNGCVWGVAAARSSQRALVELRVGDGTHLLARARFF